VCAQLLVQLFVARLADQMQVEIAQGGQERVRVAIGDHDRTGVLHLQAVTEHSPLLGQPQLEQPPRVDLPQGPGAASVGQKGHLQRIRAEHAHHKTLGGSMRAEH